MNKLFDLDSPFMTAMSRLTDMVFLSVLWFVCCLPVITIGPATAAMCFVALKWAKGESVKIFTTFFQAFKSNFKQGVALNLIFMVVGAVLLSDYIIMSNVEGTAGTVCSVCFFVMGLWTLCIMFYVYPLQAQFFNTVRQTLINAAILSMRRIPDTILLFVLNMLPVIVACLSLTLFVRLAPVWVLLAPGVLATLCGKRFAKIFAPYLKSETDENTENCDEE